MQNRFISYTNCNDLSHLVAAGGCSPFIIVESLPSKVFSFVACAAIADAAFILLLPFTTSSDEGGSGALVGGGCFGDDQAVGAALPDILLSVVGGGVLLPDDDFFSVVVTIADGTLCSSPSNPCGVVMADTVVLVIEWVETTLGGDGKLMSSSCCNSDGELISTALSLSAPPPPELRESSSSFPITIDPVLIKTKT